MYGKVHFQYATDVARCSFLVHKSISYLDLSTCELTSMAKTTSTMEGFQKLNGAESRRLLFTQNLDITYLLEKGMKEDIHALYINAMHQDPPIYVSNAYRGFIVHKEVYYRGLLPTIANYIEHSSDRLTQVRKFFRPMKVMGLFALAFYCKQYRFFTRIFLEECRDSELIVEFAEMCGEFFRHWLIMDNKDFEIMDYVLDHTQKMKYDIYNLKRYTFCPTSKSLFWGNVQNTIPLIKYGCIRKPKENDEVRNYIQFSCMFSPYAPRDLFPLHSNPVRKWLLLQLIHVFHGQRTRREESEFATHALQLMWRSIPDTFLQRSEVLSSFKESSEHRHALDQMYIFYRHVVLCGEHEEVVQPRSFRISQGVQSVGDSV